jgi:hypothetical protein
MTSKTQPLSTPTDSRARSRSRLRTPSIAMARQPRQHNEPAGNQDLWHLHVHVFPRFEGDNLYGSWYRESTFDERLDFAARLQAVL